MNEYKIMPRTLYFIRHGEADYNRVDRVNAHPHIANNLTVTGREQAERCAAQLAGERIEMVYCSEFPRARQTAEIVNKDIGAALLIDSRLNETGAFAFEGLPACAWHQAQVPDRLNAVVAGCEPFGEMKARLTAFLDSLRASPFRCIAVVSHEEPIQVMTGILEGLTDAQAKARPVGHCEPVCLKLGLD